MKSRTNTILKIMYIRKKKKKIEKYDVKILLGQLKKLLFGPKYQFKYDHNLMYIYVYVMRMACTICKLRILEYGIRFN